MLMLKHVIQLLPTIASFVRKDITVGMCGYIVFCDPKGLSEVYWRDDFVRGMWENGWNNQYLFLRMCNKYLISSSEIYIHCNDLSISLERDLKFAPVQPHTFLLFLELNR